MVLDLNTTHHTSTNETPYYLHYGREYVQHGDEYKLLLDTNPYHTREQEQLKNVKEDARDFQAEKYESRKQRNSKRVRTKKFDIGAELYLSNNKLSSGGQGYTAKLGPIKRRAYVTHKVGNDIYTLVDIHGKPLGNHHADQIMTR